MQKHVYVVINKTTGSVSVFKKFPSAYHAACYLTGWSYTEDGCKKAEANLEYTPLYRLDMSAADDAENLCPAQICKRTLQKSFAGV